MASFQELVQSDKPVLIDFHAEWCGPCKMMAPAIQQAKQRLGSRAKVLKIDVDRNPDLAQKLGIQGVPTLMIYRQGQLQWRQSGVLSAEQLVRQVEAFM